MKILTSWYAFNNDFQNNEVQETGPTYQFHKYFYDQYDEHVILSSRLPDDDDPLLIKLVHKLKRDFSNHKITPMLLGVTDVINFEEIYPKIERVLSDYSDHEVDIFFSPGTSVMQLAWFIAHQNLGYQTRLLQTRSGKFSGKTEPDLLELRVGQSAVPRSANLLQKQLDAKEQVEDYKITPSIKTVYDKAVLVAQTDRVSCLIRGESGTGKEHLANFIHAKSSRASKEFQSINCSSLGDSLLESRLFGYKKGSFTGATEDTKGLLAAAQGGTIFLDEIGDITPYMQQVLLRVLQEKEYTPVGETKARKLDVRFICATHKNLEQLCEKGDFRWDLYYRLGVTELELPTLTERGEAEKKELLNYFLSKGKKDLKKPKKLKIDKAAMQLLMDYQFPGNVRELENLVTRLYVFCESIVLPVDLPNRIKHPVKKISQTFDWKTHEKDLISRALDFHHGNNSRACKALGYGSINTLKNKITEYGIL
jgi:transcriptional regulator with PAS, ATPase and Fis domain